MNHSVLADKVQNQEVPQAHSDMHSIMAWQLYSTTNRPYISSSSMPVGTEFTAIYVGMVVE